MREVQLYKYLDSGDKVKNICYCTRHPPGQIAAIFRSLAGCSPKTIKPGLVDS